MPLYSFDPVEAEIFARRRRTGRCWKIFGAAANGAARPPRQPTQAREARAAQRPGRPSRRVARRQRSATHVDAVRRGRESSTMRTRLALIAERGRVPRRRHRARREERSRSVRRRTARPWPLKDRRHVAESCAGTRRRVTRGEVLKVDRTVLKPAGYTFKPDASRPGARRCRDATVHGAEDREDARELVLVRRATGTPRRTSWSSSPSVRPRRCRRASAVRQAGQHDAEQDHEVEVIADDGSLEWPTLAATTASCRTGSRFFPRLITPHLGWGRKRLRAPRTESEKEITALPGLSQCFASAGRFRWGR